MTSNFLNIEQGNAKNTALFSIDTDGNVNLSGGTLTLDATGEVVTMDESGFNIGEPPNRKSPLHKK